MRYTRLRVASAVIIAGMQLGSDTVMTMVAPRLSASAIAVGSDGSVAMIDPQSTMLVLSGAQGMRRIWRVPLEYRATQLAAVGNDILVACTSKESGRSAIWRVDRNGRAVNVSLPGLLAAQGITAIATAPDRRSLYMSSGEGELLQLNDRLSNVIMRRRLYETRAAGAIGVSRTGLIAVADNQGGGIKLYDRGESPRKVFTASGSFVTSLTFSGDDKFVLTSNGADPGFTQIDITSGKVARIGTSAFTPSGLATAPDGSVWAIDGSRLELGRFLPTGKRVESRKLPPSKPGT